MAPPMGVVKNPTLFLAVLAHGNSVAAALFFFTRGQFLTLQGRLFAAVCL